MKHSHFARWLLRGFWPLTALVLFCDSRVAAGFTSHGQLASDLLAPAFLLALMSQMKPQRRLVVALFLPLSTLGEGLFSLVFGLYDYRMHSIPFYVPFGHCILMSIGLMLADSLWAKHHKRRVQTSLLVLHGGLIAGTLVFLGDTLSVFFALVFILLLRRRCARPFYLILGVLVLYVEILGTRWGCWVWQPSAFGVLHTVNPPPGAFTCYVMGDLFAIKAAARIEAALANRRLRLAGVATAGAVTSNTVNLDA